MQLFEFGPYWDTLTFLLLCGIAIVVVRLCKRGINQDGGLWIKLNHNKELCFPSFRFALAWFILFFFYGFRSVNVGADTEVYVQWFYEAIRYVPKSLDDYLHLRVTEPLYTFTTYLCRQLTDNYTVYFCILGAFLAYAIIRFIYVFYGKMFNVSSMLFIMGFVASFRYCWSALRFSIAMGLVLLSLCAIAEKKNRKAILHSIIAVLFHYTSVVNLIFIIYLFMLGYFKRKKLKSIWVIFLTIAGVIVLCLSVSFLSGLFVGSKYQSYIGSGGSILGYWALLLSAVVSIYVLFAFKPLEQTTKIIVAVCLFNILLMTIALMMGAYRLTHYYAIARLYIWDYAFAHLKKRAPVSQRPILNFLAILGVLFFLLFGLSRDSNTMCFAYEFFWHAK